MSSPSVLVVVITHVQDGGFVKEQAKIHHEKWKETAQPDTRHGVTRYTHTDAAVDAFFSEMTWRDCPEGALITFGFCGNYVCPEDFMEAIRPFVRDLVIKLKYTSATVLFQHDQYSVTRVFKMDGATDLHEKLPEARFAFDVDITRVYLSKL